MSIPLHELEAQVLALEAQDRARLLERLIASFEPDSKVEQAWVEEALRREAQAKAGSARMVPGDEAIAHARARLG
ncbi:MAG: addiction module protein [Rubrivivax sp.]